MEELTPKQQEERRKRQTLECRTLLRSPEETAAYYKEVGSVDMSAHALCYACRFRGVKWVKALVENGASFDYNHEEVKLPFYIWSKIDFSLGLLKFSDTMKKAFYAQGKMHDWCFPDPYKLEKLNVTIEVLPLEERLKSFDYLVTVADKVNFDPEWFFYQAVISNNMDMVKALRERGIDLPLSKKMLTEHDKETVNDWSNLTWHLMVMSNDEFCSVVDCLLELTGADKLKFTDAIYYDIMRHRFDDTEFFKYIITHFDQKKMNKTEIMREIIKRDAIPCLPVCEEVGWLSDNRRRDTIIKYASDNNKTEAVAWLMDFKNRTADFSAEREKAEKKMMRELNADPNSIGELKKVWTYKKQDDGTLILTSYKGNSTVVTIPEKIGKDTVAAIGEYAFSAGNPRSTQNYRQARKRITKITVPDTIKHIDENAFSYCASLVEINIPEGITEISENLFKECLSLKSIRIPDSVTKISNSAFDACEALEQVNIPDKVTEIGVFAFFGCEKVKFFEIPESVKSIGKFAFSHCKSVESFTLPHGITAIGADTFAHCDNLKSVQIPDTVESIGEYAFLECANLSEVILPDGVQNIAVYAFRKCENLKTIILPSSIRQIKNFTCSGRKPETIFDESPNITAIVEPKSYAERYCKRNEIPYKYTR